VLTGDVGVDRAQEKDRAKIAKKREDRQALLLDHTLESLRNLRLERLVSAASAWRSLRSSPSLREIFRAPDEAKPPHPRHAPLDIRPPPRET
jgi:hypothetical protein